MDLMEQYKYSLIEAAAVASIRGILFAYNISGFFRMFPGMKVRRQDK